MLYSPFAALGQVINLSLWNSASGITFASTITGSTATSRRRAKNRGRDFLEPDSLYVFVRQRPESYAIPMEAEGGLELFDELIRRKLFDAELAIRAAMATEGLFCWPEGE